MAQTPLGGMGRPDVIAPAVVFLASEDAGWVTGESIRVSGGLNYRVADRLRARLELPCDLLGLTAGPDKFEGWSIPAAGAAKPTAAYDTSV